MALPPQFLDELRARTPIAAVIGRRVKLARSGRQWKGCCPFHGEKTPSFHVYEDHYHCFGCGVHGDAITFVMQSQGSTFPEAVEQLAAEAGMQVPKPSPEAAEAERRRLDLAGVLEAAAASFRRRLGLPEGKAARDYIARRGLTEETVRRFGLGWSGEGRGALAADLGREGVTQDQLLDAGLMRRDDETGRVFDLFFNRVMFPIRDRRGRIISFGGRVLGDGQPKYVNGPETALFSKRRTLYGLDFAREGARRGAAVLVVEGYMDVIALAQAGFDSAVAPLGTALTEEQLEELWRLSPSPVLCFDGDAAGGRAAARVADMALPLLSPERTLRLVTLQAGEDPDSLVRVRGPKGFQDVLDGARPLSDVLFDLIRKDIGDATPEQRAMLRTRLEDVARKIPNRELADEYRRDLKRRFFDSQRREQNVPWLSHRAADDRTKFSRMPPPVRTGPRPILDPKKSAYERTKILTAIVLLHPAILRNVDHAYGDLELDPSLEKLRDAIREWANFTEVLDFQALLDHLGSFGLRGEAEKILAETSSSRPASVCPGAHLADVEADWLHFWELQNASRVREDRNVARANASQTLTSETERKLVAYSANLKDVKTGELDGTNLASD